MIDNPTAVLQSLGSGEHWFRSLAEHIPANQLLYLIVDAAQDERIYPALQMSTNVHCCLFNEDHTTEEIKAVAPHLVKVRHLDAFMVMCLKEGLTRNWLLMFTSRVEHITQLRLHFKHFSLITTPDGKEYLFRYYDPRVMPGFISASTDSERAKLFQSVEHFYIPSVGIDQAIQLACWSREGVPQPLLPPSPSLIPAHLEGSWAAGYSVPQPQPIT